jgi:hypothetical protein
VVLGTYVIAELDLNSTTIQITATESPFGFLHVATKPNRNNPFRKLSCLMKQTGNETT